MIMTGVLYSSFIRLSPPAGGLPVTAGPHGRVSPAVAALQILGYYMMISQTRNPICQDFRVTGKFKFGFKF